ncbi:MAG: response regulator, partial [Methanospirillum sp.]|uniref:response regulator n=1 Tax=Methanospirillum sp. TaxID=45200 RepID=UPI00236B23E3
MKTILYVDDEPALLDIAQLFLEKTSEFKVITAESAKEGLEIFHTRHPDAIVSDYQMPEMNGIEFLKEVRRESAVPFIMFTGRGNEMIAMESTNSGSDYYIQKGADPRALFAELTYKIRLALSDRREETEEQRSKKTIRTLIDKTYDAVIIHNLEGRIFEVNTKMLDLFQLTREEALRFTIDELSGPGSPTAIRSDILKKVLAGEDQFLLWEARRPHDGTVFPIEKFL